MIHPAPNQIVREPTSRRVNRAYNEASPDSACAKRVRSVFGARDRAPFFTMPAPAEEVRHAA